MKTSLKIALLLITISIGIHFYLSSHYYGVQYGAAEGGASVCNINSQFNCDAVAASSYSSFMGMPVAIFGAIANLALLILLAFSIFGFTSEEKTGLRYAYWFSGAIALSSVVMLVITLTQLSVYCIFCLCLYALSFLVFFALKKSLNEKASLTQIPKDLIGLFTEHRQVLAVFILIPVISVFAHKVMLDKILDGKSKAFERLIKNSVKNWENSAAITIKSKASLVKGNSTASAPITIAEFADFRCVHCKSASHSLGAFVATHKDVQLQFYNYPLDGACNKSIGHVSGVSCRIAKAVHCAESQNLGWATHDHIFLNQMNFMQIRSSNDIDDKLKNDLSKVGVNWGELVKCMDSEATHKAIVRQANEGKKVGVKGTPTIYVNGKKLPLGQNLKALNQVRNIILSK